MKNLSAFLIVALIAGTAVRAQDAPPAPFYIISALTVSYGAHADRVALTWEDAGAPAYLILRATAKEGPFEELDETDQLSYEDITVTPGIKYWYRVLPIDVSDDYVYARERFLTEEEYALMPEKPLPVIIHNGAAEKTDATVSGNASAAAKAPADDAATKNDTSTGIKPESDAATTEAADSSDSTVEQPKQFNYSGFADAGRPAGLSYPKLISRKKQKYALPKDPAERTRIQNDLAYLQQYFMHPVKLSLVMNMAKPYFERGDLLLFADFNAQVINEIERRVMLFGTDAPLLVEFESKRLFTVFKGSADPHLAESMLAAAEAICVYSGQKEVTGDDGLTRVYHRFDAVAMTLGYYRNDAQWKSRTVMVQTSRPDLKDKLQKAQGSH